MATLTIRDFDDELKAALRVRAAQHGRSMEGEVREILRTTLTEPEGPGGLGTQIVQLFADLDPDFRPLPLPDRSDLPRAAEFPE